MDGEIKNNKAQVAIFVIIAILIIAVIALFFLLRGKVNLPGLRTKMPDVSNEIETCTKRAVYQAVDIMLPQGGYIQPKLYQLYKDNKIAYLCYINNYYSQCMMQEPSYIEHISEEIKKFISSKIEDCFYKLKQDYESKSYNIEMANTILEVNLNPKQVQIVINKQVEINRDEENKKYEKFAVKINSPIYDLSIIANEIANQEAKFCYFDYLEYMMAYPDYNIGKIDLNGEIKIYNIQDKTTKKELLMAVRSCAINPGL